MAITTPTTAQDLLQLPSDTRCELVAGELRMMSPAGWRYGEIVTRIGGLLWDHIRRHGLGKQFGAETGFVLSRDPDTVRGPDVAFIANENLPSHEPKEAFWPGAPDLAVEVLSPSDRIGEV
ncbi:MAG: Uma2 family endonuclease, partial [Planctomycetes bacterium]|nr:Uma2 family endonuclease [Planctomycetota bacterium]